MNPSSNYWQEMNRNSSVVNPREPKRFIWSDPAEVLRKEARARTSIECVTAQLNHLISGSGTAGFGALPSSDPHPMVVGSAPKAAVDGIEQTRCASALAVLAEPIVRWKPL
jgi:hypothetical protein